MVTLPFVKGALLSKSWIPVKLEPVIKNNDAAIMQCRSDKVERETGVYGGPGSGAPINSLSLLALEQCKCKPHIRRFSTARLRLAAAGLLQFANGTPFGYYSYLFDPHFIYHIDLGFEYLFDGQGGGIYFYDFTSSSFFYTSPTLFPDLHDFSLNAWLYYLADVNNPGRYTHNPRWFFNFATGQWITL